MYFQPTTPPSPGGPAWKKILKEPPKNVNPKGPECLP